jgi:hypothetical protein
MNPWYDGGGDSQLTQLYKIGNIGSGRNPGQETEYQNLLRQHNLASNATPDSYESDKALSTAKQAQQMQIEANQPAIATLNQHKTDLDSKYKDLLTSITASEQPALDAQTVATNNELGRRGITSDSGLAQNQMAKSLLPITTQFGQLQADTGVSHENDLTSLAQQIASLQAGNIPNALNFGNSTQSLAQQAQQIANNFQIQREQNDLAKQSAASGGQDRYTTLSEGQTLYDLLNGGALYTAPKTYKSSGNGSGNDPLGLG